MFICLLGLCSSDQDNNTTTARAHSLTFPKFVSYTVYIPFSSSWYVSYQHLERLGISALAALELRHVCIASAEMVERRKSGTRMPNQV